MSDRYGEGKVVYIAGRYSKPAREDREVNVRAACIYAQEVMRMGYVPFVPHAAHYIDPENTLFTYDQWMSWCLHWLKKCDILFVTSLSKGVRVEIDFAIQNAIPIVWSLAQLEWRHEEEQRRKTDVPAVVAPNVHHTGRFPEPGTLAAVFQELEDEATAAPATQKAPWPAGRYPVRQS